MKVLTLFLTLLIHSSPDIKSQQTLLCRDGHVGFFSSAPLEDISAKNEKARGIIDLGTGDFVIRVRIEDFVFPKSLMQKHFNEQYMESSKYPEATFTGKIHLPEMELPSGNTREITLKGTMTIKGTQRPVSYPVTISRDKGKLIAESTFTVRLKDHDIKIPKMLTRNIAEEVEVSTRMVFSPVP
jgi:hypothetical protein